MAANPYVQGWREWDERYADLVLGKRNWQIAAACSMAVSLVLAAGIVWQSARSRFVPYVVVTDRLGQAMTIPAPLTPASMPVVAARMSACNLTSPRQAVLIRLGRVWTSSSMI